MPNVKRINDAPMFDGALSCARSSCADMPASSTVVTSTRVIVVPSQAHVPSHLHLYTSESAAPSRENKTSDNSIPSASQMRGNRATLQAAATPISDSNSAAQRCLPTPLQRVNESHKRQWHESQETALGCEAWLSYRWITGGTFDVSQLETRGHSEHWS